jgi:hypothetical protein
VRDWAGPSEDIPESESSRFSRDNHKGAQGRWSPKGDTILNQRKTQIRAMRTTKLFVTNQPTFGTIIPQTFIAKIDPEILFFFDRGKWKPGFKGWEVSIFTFI